MEKLVTWDALAAILARRGDPDRDLLADIGRMGPAEVEMEWDCQTDGMLNQLLAWGLRTGPAGLTSSDWGRTLRGVRMHAARAEASYVAAVARAPYDGRPVRYTSDAYGRALLVYDLVQAVCDQLLLEA